MRTQLFIVLFGYAAFNIGYDLSLEITIKPLPFSIIIIFNLIVKKIKIKIKMRRYIFANKGKLRYSFLG